MKTAYIFSGQGSQKKGMGKNLFDEFKHLTEKANNILNYNIKKLCIEDSQNLLDQTDYTQPALYIVNSFAWLKKKESAEKPHYFAGHSLGEYNALFAAKAFDFETGLKLVQKRAKLMSLAKKGGMAAVIGLSESKIVEILRENNFSEISVANYNSYEQTVISGIKNQIEKAETLFKKAGAKMYIILPVSGAFHSEQMTGAKEKFVEFIKQFQFNPPQTPVISNVTAQEYEDNNIKDLLCLQITSPVKWRHTVEYLIKKGEMQFEEIGDGKILTNFVKRIKKSLGAK
ncbi:MAG: ACP S-malonyltransferase [Deltaproteobacteria bacterium]|nr:ACP S-malonyltransferase [Deltaproteobacteria bacterium]